MRLPIIGLMLPLYKVDDVGVQRSTHQLVRRSEDCEIILSRQRQVCDLYIVINSEFVPSKTRPLPAVIIVHFCCIQTKTVGLADCSLIRFGRTHRTPPI